MAFNDNPLGIPIHAPIQPFRDEELRKELREVKAELLDLRQEVHHLKAFLFPIGPSRSDGLTITQEMADRYSIAPKENTQTREPLADMLGRMYDSARENAKRDVWVQDVMHNLINHFEPFEQEQK